MLCPNCETENRDGAKFCDECGFPLTGAIAARAAEVAAFEQDVSADEDIALESEAEAVKTADDLVEVDPTETIDAVEPTDDGVAEAQEDEPLDGATQVIDDLVEGAGETEGATELIDIPNEQAAEEAASPDVTVALGADLTGIDHIEGEYGESVVNPDYENIQPNWRDGNTMQMPRIEGEEAHKSRDFLASSTTEQKRSKKVIIGVIAAIVAVAAIIAFATYQMELWGGKAVPDVRGMTEADATSVLEESGFAVRSTQVKSDDTEGLVLLMDPTAGSRANEGDEIVIHIATARSVPDIVGKTREQAEEALAEEGYENVTFENERSDAEEGTILSISPEPGTRAKSTVAVIVKVAEAYTVPDTSGMGVDGAIEAVQAAGLSYDIAYVETQDYPEGTLLGTNPEAGAKVKSDTVVVLSVARARGVQLTKLTTELITPGYELNLDGTSYVVSSLNSTNYLGDDQVAFTATARPYTVFFGVYVEGDPQEVSGVVTFTSDNQVSSIS